MYHSQVQTAPQQQAVALVLPRVEPPSSGPTQEQGTSSSSSSNTVTTTQAGLKRQRDSDTDPTDEQTKVQQQNKRSRVQQTGTVSDSGLEVEYQVPTSSQRDHDDDNVEKVQMMNQMTLTLKGMIWKEWYVIVMLKSNLYFKFKHSGAR
jgi:hypothetical protein